MVVVDDFVIALLVIVPVVVVQLGTSLHFLCSRCTDEIYLRVFQYLLLLVVRQLILKVDQGLLRGHGELRFLLILRRSL